VTVEFWVRWAGFVLVESVLCLTPGPAVLLVVAQALSRGAAASAWSALGILHANVLYFALSVTGLGVVLFASYALFSLVRWLGVAYLVWLGVRMLLGQRAVRAPVSGPAQTGGGRRTFVSGFVLQATNPKALLFFVALLPQFIDPTGNVAVQIAILGITSVAIELVALLGYGFAAGRLRGRVVNPRIRRLAEGAAGAMLVGAAVGAARV
jgi:threonine/homoserine/homoserine lactone efflux protein